MSVWEIEGGIVTWGGGIREKGRGGHPSNDGYKGRMRGGEARMRDTKSDNRNNEGAKGSGERRGRVSCSSWGTKREA